MPDVEQMADDALSRVPPSLTVHPFVGRWLYLEAYHAGFLEGVQRARQLELDLSTYAEASGGQSDRWDR